MFSFGGAVVRPDHLENIYNINKTQTQELKP